MSLILVSVCQYSANADVCTENLTVKLPDKFLVVPPLFQQQRVTNLELREMVSQPTALRSIEIDVGSQPFCKTCIRIDRNFQPGSLNLRANGHQLPFRDGTIGKIVYKNAMNDYSPEAFRALTSGGDLWVIWSYHVFENGMTWYYPSDVAPKKEAPLEEAYEFESQRRIAAAIRSGFIGGEPERFRTDSLFALRFRRP